MNVEDPILQIRSHIETKEKYVSEPLDGAKIILQIKSPYWQLNY